MSITPISWQNKIDNPELVLLLQGYSEQEYLTAAQINQIKEKINLLIEASTLTGVFDYTTTTSILPAGSPETIIKTVLIPANTFSNLDWLTLNVCMYDNVYLASFFNFYINSSTSLVGATKLMNLKFDGWGNQVYYAVNDNILLKDNKIIGLFQLTSISSGMIDTVGYNSAIDLTVNNYIIITYKNSFDQGCNVNIESVILQKTN